MMKSIMRKRKKQTTSYSHPVQARRTQAMTVAILATLMLSTSAALPSALISNADAASSTTKTTASKQAVSAETAQRSYDLFLQRLQKPATLGLARATLVNRIYQFDRYRATIAVLQLENAYNKHASYADNLIFAESIQNELMRVYKSGMTMQQAANKLTRAADRQALQKLADMGYRLETSEGVFYTINDYPAFSVFFPYISSDIKDYINIMSAEVKAPTAYDAGIVIPPAELLRRGLAMEDFLNRYATSNRRAVIESDYRLSRWYIFYGSDNTPLFDSQTLEIDPQFQEGYRKLLSSYSAEQIKKSELLTDVSDLLKLVDQNGGKQTQAVEDWLKQHVDDLL